MVVTIIIGKLSHTRATLCLRLRRLLLCGTQRFTLYGIRRPPRRIMCSQR